MKVVAFARVFVIVLVFTTVYAALFALPVMLLWNYLFADSATSILGAALPPLDFWRALALLALCRLLFKGPSALSK